MNELLVKYFSARMLGTLDMNQLFQCLFQQFGECQIEFVPMTTEERAEASREVNGIDAVSERFRVFHRTDAGLVRQPDVERKIVHLGQKQVLPQEAQRA